jgi:hypothetical protein
MGWFHKLVLESGSTPQWLWRWVRICLEPGPFSFPSGGGCLLLLLYPSLSQSTRAKSSMNLKPISANC